jgi:hypothetical protein
MARKLKITESQLNKLLEVRYIDTRHSIGNKVEKSHWYDTSMQEPIMNGEKIRVFHGCSLKTAAEAVIKGLSGKERHNRAYSYESGMNPLGLFVTVDFHKAKDFGYSSEGMCVLEFTVDASDLESPVWNGQDTYFGQGSNPMPFSNADERNAQKLRYREKALSTPDETFTDWFTDKNGNRNFKKKVLSKAYIRDSSKPELAKSIFDNNEHQALFMGNLNPNMIKRVWVNLPKKHDDGDTYISSTENYVPMSRKKFYRLVKNMEFYVEGYYNKYSKIDNQKLFNPNDDVISKENVAKKYYERFDRMHGDSLEDTVKWLDDVGFFDGEKLLYNTSIDYIRELFWPKQIIQLFGKDFFDKYFNRLGQV